LGTARHRADRYRRPKAPFAKRFETVRPPLDRLDSPRRRAIACAAGGPSGSPPRDRKSCRHRPTGGRGRPPRA